MVSRFINIFGPSGCGKTHLANIFNKKINSFFINARYKIFFQAIKARECLIIDDYTITTVNEKFILFYFLN